MPILHIQVNNKIATYQRRGGAIVCGNSDYEIKFTFDEEWNATSEKFAHFIWNGKHTDVKIEGDTCAVPMLKKATRLEVGVYAKNIRTSTSAVIPCAHSTLCGDEPLTEADQHFTSLAEQAAMEAAESAKEAKAWAVESQYGYVGADIYMIPEGATTVPTWTTYAKENIKCVVIPSTITELRQDAFRGMTGLRKITIPKTVTSIKPNTFRDCVNLEKVELEEGIKITEIPISFCENCVSLHSIKIPRHVTSILQYAFQGCSELSRLSFEVGSVLENIESYAFRGTAILEIVVPDNVETLKQGTFYQFTNLRKVKIGYRVNAIENAAIYSQLADDGKGEGDCVIDLTAYGQKRAFPTLANTVNFLRYFRPGDSTGSIYRYFSILVPSGRKAELASMTNWAQFASQMVEV